MLTANCGMWLPHWAHDLVLCTATASWVLWIRGWLQRRRINRKFNAAAKALAEKTRRRKC